MKLIDEAKDGLERAEAGTAARLEKARDESGMATWLATIIDSLTLIICLYGVFVAGGFWIIPSILFGVIATAELGSRVWGVVR